MKEQAARRANPIPASHAVLFLEVTVCDASDFEEALHVQGVELGQHRVLRVRSAAVPNTIAAVLLYLRDATGELPHAYFGWNEGHPITSLLRFIFFGEGDIALVTHEVLRQAEPDLARRPAVHVE